MVIDLYYFIIYQLPGAVSDINNSEKVQEKKKIAQAEGDDDDDLQSRLDNLRRE